MGAFFASQKTGLCGGSAAYAAAPRPYNPFRGKSSGFAGVGASGKAEDAAG
jgi:hypothetical protein